MLACRRKIEFRPQSTGFLVLPKNITTKDTAQLYSSGGGGMIFYGRVEDAVRQIVRRERLVESGADTSVITTLNKPVAFATKKISDKGVEKDSGEALAIVGYVLGLSSCTLTMPVSATSD